MGFNMNILVLISSTNVFAQVIIGLFDEKCSFRQVTKIFVIKVQHQFKM